MTSALEAQPDDSPAPIKFLGLFPVQSRPPGFAQGKTLPEARSRNFVSKILFSWLTPILIVGYSRPLEIEDLWELVPEYEATRLGVLLEKNFYARVPPSERPSHLRKRAKTGSREQTSSPVADQATLKDEGREDDKDAYELRHTDKTTISTPTDGLEDEDEVGKKYDRSLLLALNQTVLFRFWSAGVLGVIGFALQTTSPLVSQKILKFMTASYEYSHGQTDEVPPGARYGVGLCFGLWAMQQASSLFMNQFLNRSLITGFMLRSSLIANISRKSLRLSGESRAKHPNGQLVTNISADASFLDWCALLAHELWIQPIQIVIGLGILIHTIGYSALVGLGVLVLAIPAQAYLFSKLITTRQAQMKVVDKRIRLLQEILQGYRVMKFMAYENYFETRVMDFRMEEVEKLRRNCFFKATMTAVMSAIPVIAAVLTFVTYSLSGHQLNVATIFTALQAFNNIRAPLTLLPLAFQTTSDAYVGLKRISKVLLADEISEPVPIKPSAEFAISSYADYAWESAAPPDDNFQLPKGPGGPGGRGPPGGPKKAKKSKAEKKAAEKSSKESEKTPEDAAIPFSLRDINLQIKRGSFVVVCGRVGSGKSSLVQAMLGEMKKTRGSAYLGGSTSYFPQNPWIQNATVRENILFGDEKPDEARFREAIRSCALESDVAMLAHGLQTEIGERGINLSGGQKARVCLARCVYSDADICFLDDPLSAVDAHVSAKLVDCFTSGPLKSKTRFLVTHHLEVLPKADLIITMGDGCIQEMGTYNELLESKGAMSKLIADHLSDSQQASPSGGKGDIENAEDIELKKVHLEDEIEAAHDKEEGGGAPKTTVSAQNLTTKEERTTGTLSGSVYLQYAKSMGGLWKAPIFLGLLLVAQTANVGTTVFLSFWSESSLGWSQGRYMGVYAALGLSYTLLIFCGSLTLFLAATQSSYNLFNGAFLGIMRTTVAWHDQTPIGRIISRLSKDIISLDDQLPTQFNQLLTQGLSILGTVALVFYSFPYLGIIFPFMFFLYGCTAAFYRASSREVKRIDSIQRSFIYQGFGEMLTGMSSVRAFRSEKRFIDRTDRTVDVENRAYIVTIVLQRWLGVRLDAMGALLVLAIGLFGVGYRDKTSPAKLGVVLTYSLAMTQILSQLVNVFAQVEQEMNCAERTLTYGALPREDPLEKKSDVPPQWPSEGAIDFDHVILKYREDLPPVLKGTTFSIRAGEKVGIVGRTGAGKSSLLQALFRTVEISGGKISIDGQNLRQLDLHTLRSQLGIVPQDPFLWNGSVRINLDPNGDRTDAELNDALRRCHLAARPEHSAEVRSRLEKFKLDSLVQDEGANFSAGERQLLALARVVVRNSKVILLDEATSSVDVETDGDIQDTIRLELKDKTLLCIAHRLATIAFYDRVIVMDAGEVIEIGHPLVLFDQPDSVFRGMCEKAALSRDDIVRIRESK